MAATYTIGLDLAPVAWRITDKTRQVADACDTREGGADACELVLIGPFAPGEGCTEQEIRALVERTTAADPFFSLLIDGWDRDRTDGWHRLYFSVVLSERCRIWASSVAARLGNGAAVTPAMRMPAGAAVDARTMRRIWRRLGRRAGLLERVLGRIEARSDPRRDWFVKPLLLPLDSPRIVLSRDGVRIDEFDLPTRRWLSPERPDRKADWEVTLQALRRSAGYEHTASVRSEEREIFVIGDLHLGHRESIRYGARPFPDWDGETMDEVLIANWNHVVGPSDRVIFLGDLSYNETGAPLRAVRGRLNGRITFIRGNHDTGLAGAEDQLVLRYRGEEILLIKNPKKAPPGFGGWIVHGHTHNSDLARSPYIDRATRRINVSAEVVGYAPVSLSSIFGTIGRMDDRPGSPLRQLVRDREF